MSQSTPQEGTYYTFSHQAAPTLAGIPGKVIAVQPLRNGDYLVTLEYARPVRCGGELVQHVDGLASQLWQVAAEVGA